MAQSGQYNFARCIRHGESGAARIALTEFARNAIGIIFLLNHAHMPYYKWAFKAMRELEILGEKADVIEKLIDTPNNESDTIERCIESICADVILELRGQDITESDSDYLEHHAYSINSKIKNNKIRNMSVML